MRELEGAIVISTALHRLGKAPKTKIQPLWPGARAATRLPRPSLPDVIGPLQVAAALLRLKADRQLFAWPRGYQPPCQELLEVLFGAKKVLLRPKLLVLNVEKLALVRFPWWRSLGGDGLDSDPTADPRV